MENKKYVVQTNVKITYTRIIEAGTRKEAEEIADSMGELGAHDATSGSDGWKARLYFPQVDDQRYGDLANADEIDSACRRHEASYA